MTLTGFQPERSPALSAAPSARRRVRRTRVGGGLSMLSARQARVVVELSRAVGALDIWALAEAAGFDDELWERYTNEKSYPVVVDYTNNIIQQIREKFGAEAIRYERGVGYTLGPLRQERG